MTHAMVMHHVGCAVKSIPDAVRHYTGPLGCQRVSRVVHVKSQSVNVCFVETAPGVYIELIEPTGDEAPVHNLLKQRVRWYHVCFAVDDVPAAVAQLQGERFKLVAEFASEAFAGTPCAFLYTPDLVLIELCTAGAFDLL